MDTRAIGIFDSGVGGLTIWRAVRRLLPNERLIYLADTAYFPYGARSADELAARAISISSHLLAHGCTLIVVACNTATVAALAQLRATYPHVPFVGVVPVVKVLAERTRTGTIALLSTPGTAASPYVAELAQRFAHGMRLVNVGCEGLAAAVEHDGVQSARTLALLDRYLAPVRASGADVLGLGCTHYPFLQPAIARLLGPTVQVFDSAEPVARRVRALLTGGAGTSPLMSGARTARVANGTETASLPDRAGTAPLPDRAGTASRAGRAAPARSSGTGHRFFTTGAPAPFAACAGRLLGQPVPAEAAALDERPAPARSHAATARRA